MKTYTWTQWVIGFGLFVVVVQGIWHEVMQIINEWQRWRRGP